jgi:hypothetical protein
MQPGRAVEQGPSLALPVVSEFNRKKRIAAVARIALTSNREALRNLLPPHRLEPAQHHKGSSSSGARRILAVCGTLFKPAAKARR